MKIVFLKYFFFGLLILILFGFASPLMIFCDGADQQIQNGSNNLLAAAGGLEPNTSNFDNGIYTIVITSVVIIGVLVFAMWKTFRSKRQY